MRRAFAIAIAASLVAACGMRGPLYLPKADAKHAQKSKPAGTTTDASAQGAAAVDAAAALPTSASQ